MDGRREREARRREWFATFMIVDVSGTVASWQLRRLVALVKAMGRKLARLSGLATSA
jgi:hypothetical protein